jgi:hypothetical protein
MEVMVERKSSVDGRGTIVSLIGGLMLMTVMMPLNRG